jgi:hypothetical protein
MPAETPAPRAGTGDVTDADVRDTARGINAERRYYLDLPPLRGEALRDAAVARLRAYHAGSIEVNGWVYRRGPVEGRVDWYTHEDRTDRRTPVSSRVAALLDEIVRLDAALAALARRPA